MAKYQTQIIERQKIKWHPHVAKAFSPPEQYLHVEHHRKLVYEGQS